jgi:phenylalanyl-tRNA synthetase beta chain
VKISINWLRDFVDCQLPASELETLLRRAGLEVAGIDQRGAAIDHVVAAEILESTQHPNADRLSVCKVNDGSPEPRQIVCGAKNYKVGDKVPLALPGAVLPGDFKIKTGKLRGVESEGMMCSAKELRLAEDSEGLLILPPETTPGTPIKDLFPAETILELEITPNRSDWLSHLGVVREIGVFTGLPVKAPEPALPPTASAEGSVRLEGEGCAFYTLRRISGVKVGPSPQWLRDRLAAVGLRSVNNVVDVTNYVLLELGQPLHAFDAAKISGPLQVRAASEGEAFRALDGREYKLPAGSLVIADDNGPAALAGVMGGEGSGVSEFTTDILLESAVFDPSRVRRASRALALFSDSSYRFERGVDPEGVILASARAVELILQVAGGTAEPVLLVAGKCPERGKVSLRHSRVRDLLGISLSNSEIESSLARVGLEKLAAGDETRWSIPGYRRELRREADLIEEIARVVGIEKIPSLAQGPFAASSDADAAYDLAMNLRRSLAGMGFHEARTSTLVSAADVSHFGEAVALKNPFGEDQSQLRNSLVPGLLAALRRNLDQGAKSIALFECGRVFKAAGEGQRLAIVLTGERHESNWRGESVRSWDVFDLTGAVRQLAGLSEKDIVPMATPAAPFGACADVFLNGKQIGVVGQLAPAVARDIGASAPLLAAEFDLDLWRAAASAKTQVAALAKFPGSARDIAFVAPLALPYGEVRSLIETLKEPLLESVRLFDLFTDPKGEKIPSDKKSMAISLTFRSPERTLTADEIQAAADRIKVALREKLGVDFRE